MHASDAPGSERSRLHKSLATLQVEFDVLACTRPDVRMLEFAAATVALCCGICTCRIRIRTVPFETSTLCKLASRRAYRALSQHTVSQLNH